MRITKEGKAVFDAAMAHVGLDVCRIALVTNDEGSEGLRIGLVDRKDAKRLVTVDGVDLDLDEMTERYLADFVFDGEGDRLKVGVPSKGCCGHHHHGECCHGGHHEDGDCCCDGHHEEGECCCGEDGCDEGCCPKSE